MRLKDKVAIITGAASGMGRASAILFTREGAKVAVADVNDAQGEETVRMIEASGGVSIFVHTDVSKAAEVERLVKTTVDRFGRLDILFNNAGRPQRPIPVTLMTEEEWDLLYSINVKGIFLGAKYAVPEMRKLGGGVIINTASISGVRPRPFNVGYASSKGAAIMLTKSLAIDLARYNIRVNAINPVAAETPMLAQFAREGAGVEEARRFALATIPLGRLCQAEDVAFAALYLASDESSMVTGSTLDLDGGRGIQPTAELGIIEPARDPGTWLSDTIPDKANWLAQFVSSLEAPAKAQQRDLSQLTKTLDDGRGVLRLKDAPTG